MFRFFVFGGGLSGVLSLSSCFTSFAEIGPLLSPCLFVVQLPHVPSPTVCLVSGFLLLHFILFFPSISMDVGATTGIFRSFPNEFLLCDYGPNFLYRLV